MDDKYKDELSLDVDLNGEKSIPEEPKHPPGIGIALGGGMARGFFHIGVLKTLDRHGIKPSIVSGTSIGAVVGGCYLAGALDQLEEWALSLNRLTILSYLDFRVRSAGLIGGNKLSYILEDNFGDMKIEDLPHPLITIAADLRTGHEVWIRKGSLVEAMKASFALPGVFPPVKRKDRFLVDGALVNPLPISACQAMGARMTIGSDLHADIIGKAAKPGEHYQTVSGFDPFDEKDVSKEDQGIFSSTLTKRLFRREEHNPSLFGVMVSSLGIMQDRMTRSRLAGDPPDIHLKAPVGHIGLLEFEKASELIQIGEVTTEKALPEIMDAMKVFLPPHTNA